MTKMITGKFNSSKAAHNAHEDLIDTGYPVESVHLDRGKSEVMVRTSTDAEPEVREILGRHTPFEITETTV